VPPPPDPAPASQSLTVFTSYFLNYAATELDIPATCPGPATPAERQAAGQAAARRTRSRRVRSAAVSHRGYLTPPAYRTTRQSHQAVTPAINDL